MLFNKYLPVIFIAGGAVSQTNDGMEPVSYTHLDVYKRQVRTLYRKNLEEADAQQIFQAVSYAIKDRIVENWMETQNCLLYTSRCV